MIGFSNKSSIFALLLGSLLVAACGDSGSGGSGGTGAASNGGSGGTASQGGNSSNGGSPNTGGAGGGTPSTDKIVINEIQGHHPEWIEIANAGNAAVDVSGFGVCDEDANGACEVGSAMRFPAGSSLAAGAHIVIVTDDPSTDPGPNAIGCPNGVATCYHATWQIGAADGETLRVIDDADVEVASFTYPANATPDATVSWSRLPDLTGSGAIGTPTPGAPNMP
ncbi:MAG: lamin tail domain-containing protein [Polyangiaceae bacterium]